LSAFRLGVDRFVSHLVDPHDVSPEPASAVVGPDYVWQSEADEWETWG